MRTAFAFLSLSLFSALSLTAGLERVEAQIEDAGTVTTASCPMHDAPPAPAEAAEPPEVAAPPETSTESAAWLDYPRNAAFEVNVLWPFFPGGIVVLRAAIPVLFPDRGDFRGELIVGAYADFAWRIVRDSEHHGRVGILAGLLGWRQFFVYGLHLEAMVMAGWRNEIENPYDGQPIDAFQGRLFVSAGYQHEFTRTFYANLRGGFGLHLFRTDRFADRERVFVPTADLNIGLRF